MSENSSSRTDRIQIDDAVHELYKQLSDTSTSVEQAPLVTMKDVFMWAVALGYRRGKRISVPSGSKFTIRRDVFKETDITLLKAIALAETNDVAVLLRLGDILTIAEEYAQAGIHEVKSYLLDQSGRPLWNLVDIIDH